MLKFILSSVVAFLISQNLFSQHTYIAPFIGHGITIASSDRSLSSVNTPNNDFEFAYPKMNYSKYTPLTFGVKIEHEFKKSRYGLGVIFGDETGSSFMSGILTPAPTSPLTNYLDYELHESYVGRFLTKIPISYNYKLLTAHHFGNDKKFFDLSLHTGFNIFIIKKWDDDSFGGDMVKFDSDGQDGWMIQPNSKVYNTVDGNTAGFTSWECNLQKGWSVSFDIGVDMDWYIKDRRRFTTSLYYEQGTRNVSAIVNQIYFNNVYQGVNAIYSRGSALQFKLYFPIEILKKYNARNLD